MDLPHSPLCETKSVPVHGDTPDSYRKHSHSMPNVNFRDLRRLDSDEGVVADCPGDFAHQNVIQRPTSMGKDSHDGDLGVRHTYRAASESSDEGTDMRQVWNRQHSFRNWPLAYQNPSSMTAAGLFYTGQLDHVQCAFCRGSLGNWRVTDSPMAEHSRHFPRCPFVLSKATEARPSTPPTPSTPSMSGSASDGEMAGEDVCGWSSPGRNPEPLLVPAAPAVPSMALFQDRFATFFEWPREKRQTPRDLACAGLFYTGQGDVTTCFHCGGNLHRWDTQDQPWTEHARLYPNCQYLIASKGRNFVSLALAFHGASGSENVLIRSSITNSSLGSSAETTNSQSSGIEDEGWSSQGSHSSDRSMTDDESEEEIIGQTIMRHSNLMDAIQEAVTENRQNLSFSRFQNEEHLVEAAKAIQCRNRIKKDMLKKESQRETLAYHTDIASMTKEYERLRAERVCKVCLDKESQMTFQPCGHMVCCSSCADAVQKCPVCRTVISQKSRVYLA